MENVIIFGELSVLAHYYQVDAICDQGKMNCRSAFRNFRQTMTMILYTQIRLD